MLDFLERLLLAWIPLFVAMDPLGMVPVFLGVTGDLEQRERVAVANQATVTAAAAALGFMFLGKAVFRALGIGVADFQVAGGLILLVLAGRDLVAPERGQAQPQPDMGVVPLGLPLIVGPATLTAVLALVDSVGWPATLAALALNLTLVNLCLRFGEFWTRLIGVRGLRALSKVVALLLAAIAVNMIRRGWQAMGG